VTLTIITLIIVLSVVSNYASWQMLRGEETRPVRSPTVVAPVTFDSYSPLDWIGLV